MSWNYRVVRALDSETGQLSFTIREVYYDKTGAPYNMTQEGMLAYGETFDELRIDLMRQVEALDRPVLEDEVIE